MVKVLKIYLLITVIFSGLNLNAQAEDYEKGQLFAQIKTGKMLLYQTAGPLNNDQYKEFGITGFSKAFKINEEPLNRIFLVTFTNTEKIDDLIQQLQTSGMYDYVEKVPRYTLHYTPNDLQSVQWHLNKIMAQNAWDIQKGKSSIVIGLVDDALDTAHQDLEPIVWRNKNEIRGNGIDDDGNGYTDDYIGWDFADNDNDPSSGSSLKHGTHCGGIAAAKTDNSTGIASIGFGCQLMIAKIGKAGYSYLFSPYQGVEYAIINKANVISMSWGGGGYSYTYQLIFDNAYKKGIVCVAAAGNSSTSITSFPAGYNHVIAVGSTTSGDVVSGFSNYGTWVDVMAPGSGIYSTLPGNSYGNLSGTSMACPLVSGLCALMLSKNPNASPDEIEKCLKSGCDNINSNNSGFIGQMGAGRINAENSLKCMKPITADFTSNFTRICQGDTIQFFDKSSPTPAAIKWIFQGGTPATSLLTNPKVRYASNGIYDVQLIAFGNNFSDTIIRKQYVTVSKPTAILSGIRTIFEGNSTTIQVDFTGNAPWSVTYSDGTISTTLNNITVTPYYISVKPIVNTNYTLTAMSDRGCSGIISGAASVNVKKASNNCSNALKYQLSLGGALDDFGYDISEDANNNVYVSGNTLNYGNGDGYFAKFNSDGNLVWFKTYGGSANDVIYKHMQTPDKGALLIGFTYSYGAGSQDVMIIKVDTSGTVQWSKTVGGSGDDWGWNAAVTSDGGYYVYGATTTYGAGDFDNYLIKIDKNGNLKWTKTYGNSYYSTMSGLATFDDGSAVFCSNYRTSTSGDNLVAKIDSVGNLVWSKRFGGSFNDAPYKLTKGNDNNIYVVGAERTSSTNQEMFVACFTPSGNTKWIKSINGAGNESFYSVEPDGDDIIISGFTDTYGNGLSDISMIKMDTSGNILFSKTIGGTKEEVSLSLIKSTDGAYYSAGHTKSFTNGNNDIFINKFNCTPIVGCNEKDYTPTTGNFNLPLSDENQSVSTGGTLNTQTISATKRSLGVTYQCKTTGSSSCLKVDNFTKISSTTPGFTGQLKDGDYFGQAVRNIGDFDGDGINDIAVGAQLDDDGGSNQGAIYLMMLNANGTIKSKQKISATQGGFTGSLSGHNFFGSSVARIKDLDGDGFDDIAVGQIYDNTGTTRAGAVWILFMKADGTVKSHQKIANGTGGFPSVLDADDNFGIDITDMGDIDGDGSTDIAVGAHLDDDGGTDRGAVYILYLKNDGTVKSYKKISATSGGFSGTLRNGDGFGYGLASKTGDFNNDGINDLLVGSRNDDDGGTDRGAVWFLYLNSSETVIGQKKLSSTSTGLSSKLNNSDYFGSGVEVVGDINNDNIDDILVSAPGDKDGATNAGAVWLLLMTKDYDINSTIKISKLSQQVINNQIDASDYMGWKVSFLNDIDNNGFKEIVTGAMLDDDGGTDRGAVYILNLSDSCKYKCINPGFQSKISGTQGGFTGSLDNSDRFGAGVNGIGDIDKDGVQDIAICADSDDDGGTNLGAIWIVLMNANGTVKSQSKISATQGGFSGNITNGLYFGIRIVPLGDLNSDGVPDIAVGHHYESSVTTRAGAVWILFLNADGTVKSHQKI
ncbi:MAG: S8 family serine peptidase, partial [Bacteroidota bacterium]